MLLCPSLLAADGEAFLRFTISSPCRAASAGTSRRSRPTAAASSGLHWGEAEFRAPAPGFCDRHRVARSYKKNERAFIESFNRSVRKECLGWGTFRPEEIAHLTPEVEAFLERYHYHRPHLAFTPMRPPLTRP